MFNEIDDKTPAADISAMIGAELFAKEAPSEASPEVESDIPASPDAPELEAKLPVGEVTETALQAPAPTTKPLPKAWKREKEALWSKLDPEAHDYIYQREADIMRGLQQYQSGHEQWNQVIQPFRHVMEQHPDVNPTELLQNLMTNHLDVVRAPKAQKISLIRNIIQGYGLDLSEVLGNTTSPGSQIPPEVQQLQGELSAIKTHLLQSPQTAYQKALDAETVKVNAFFADPKNEYASDLSDDILRILKTGTADSLDAAYEQAQWLNPVVRQKILAKQRAEALGEAEKPKPTNIESSGEARPRSRKPKDWQSGVDSIINKHYGSNH